MDRFFISGTNGDGLDEVKVTLRDYIAECGHQPIISRFGRFDQDIPDVIKNCILQVRKCAYFILLINKTAGNYTDQDETETITEAEFNEAFKTGDLCKIIVFVKSATWHEHNFLKRNAKKFKTIEDKLLEGMYAESRVYDFVKRLDKLVPKPPMYPFDTSEDIKRQLEKDWSLPPEQEVLYDGTEIYTDNVYNAYREAEGKTILSYISTWPILPDKLEENETLDVQNWTIMGPITKDRMAGVLWRMAVNKVRARNNLRPIILLHRWISGTKFIIAGSDTVLIPVGKNPEERTRKHIIRRSEEEVAITTERFFRLSQDAISAEERICIIIRDDIMVDVNHMKVSEIVKKLFNHWEKLGEKNTKSMDETICQEVIWECINCYGDSLGMTIQGSRSMAENVVRKKGQAVRNQKTAMIDHRLTYGRYRESIGEFPSFRVVITNRCNLKCEYCPPNNENYASNESDIDIESMSLVLNTVVRIGCQKICFTGGEPLQHERFFTFLKGFSLKNTSVVISFNTNGSLITQEMLEDMKAMKNITLKVSFDTLDRNLYERITGSKNFDKVKRTIEEARAIGIRVGINFVLRRENKNELLGIIDFARKHRAYVKILDLNWYIDIGKRKDDSKNYGDRYWEHNYCSVDEIRDLVIKEVGPLRKVISVGGYGIPMWETEDKEGFFVRIKDWREGAHYSNTATCRLCEYFRNRKCHEGIYQLTLTSDLKLKICRHRPELAVSLARTIQTCRDNSSNKAIQDKIREVLKQYFYNSKLL